MSYDDMLCNAARAMLAGASTTRNDERPPAATDEEIDGDVDVHERIEDAVRRRTLEQTARMLRERPVTAQSLLRAIQSAGIETRQPTSTEQRGFQRRAARIARSYDE